MYRKNFIKPDGRNLYLYSRYPISDEIIATTPKNNGMKANPHMRWHPLRKEWVIYATHRQDRTFLPPKDYSPLKVTTDENFPTELPQGNYDVAVFDNLFPSLIMSADATSNVYLESKPSKGSCEVVVFTQDPEQSLGELALDHVKLILEVWADRTKETTKIQEIKYIMPFENRGVEMGVTLHHPHGQIYSYPFIPPAVSLMMNSMKEYYDSSNKNLLGQIIKEEMKAKNRIIAENDYALSFVPACARYTYETWITTKRDVAFLHELSSQEIHDLAVCLKTTLMKYDRLWNKPFPYLMTLIQAPVNSGDTTYAHFYFQIYPPYRTKDRLKYLAGTEIGAGIFVNDSLPEEKARELQAVQVKVNL